MVFLKVASLGDSFPIASRAALPEVIVLLTAAPTSFVFTSNVGTLMTELNFSALARNASNDAISARPAIRVETIENAISKSFEARKTIGWEPTVDRAAFQVAKRLPFLAELGIERDKGSDNKSWYGGKHHPDEKV